MKQSHLVWVLVLVVIIFSAIPIAELWLLKLLGFDIVAHLQFTSAEGSNFKFYLEAFGAVAFVIAQTVILTALFVWTLKKLGPILLKNTVTMLMNILE